MKIFNYNLQIMYNQYKQWGTLLQKSPQKSQNKKNQNKSFDYEQFFFSLDTSIFEHHKKTILAIIIAIILIYLQAYTNQKQQPSKSIKNVNQSQLYLHVSVGQYNQKIRLTYLKPQQIIPKNITQRYYSPQLHITEQQYIKINEMNLQSLQFKQKLYLNWLTQKQQLFKAEYIYYNKKYNMSARIPQRHLCIISPYHNLISSKNKSYKLFLKSISSQNYSNYNIYMIDDVSDDNSIQQLLKQIIQYPLLNNRLTIIKNKQHIGALGNRDIAIRNYCAYGSIVLDIDGDDAIIGKQVFNFINRFYYYNPSAWFVYTNFLSIVGQLDGGGRDIDLQYQMQAGFCRKIEQKIFDDNSYRTDHQWVTSLLRTYLRDLYMKIPLSHVLQPGTRKYYIQATDRFSMYALAELAGKYHTFYLDEYIYFYYEPNFIVLQQKGCKLFLKFYAEAQARILTPLKTLSKLSDKVQIVKDYKAHDWVHTLYGRRRNQYYKCLEKYRQKKDKQLIE